MSDRNNPYGHSEQDLDLPESEMEGTAMLDSQVQKAQEQLLALRRQADQIEKQKRELEDLSQRQEELERGKTEMVGKLARSLTVLEREAREAEKRVDQLRSIHQSFSEHLDVLETINPKSWLPNELGKELAKAQSDVEDARSVFTKNRSKIETEIAEENAHQHSPSSYSVESGPAHGFLYWLNAGFAFTLPILLLGIIALAIFLTRP